MASPVTVMVWHAAVVQSAAVWITISASTELVLPHRRPPLQAAQHRLGAVQLPRTAGKPTSLHWQAPAPQLRIVCLTGTLPMAARLTCTRPSHATTRRRVTTRCSLLQVAVAARPMAAMHVARMSVVLLATLLQVKVVVLQGCSIG